MPRSFRRNGFMVFQERSKEGEAARERALVARLRQFVEDSDLSFYKIVSRVGTSGRILSMWIAGTARPRAEELAAIKRFLQAWASFASRSQSSGVANSWHPAPGTFSNRRRGTEGPFKNCYCDSDHSIHAFSAALRGAPLTDLRSERDVIAATAWPIALFSSVSPRAVNDAL